MIETCHTILEMVLPYVLKEKTCEELQGTKTVICTDACMKANVMELHHCYT